MELSASFLSYLAAASVRATVLAMVIALAIWLLRMRSAAARHAAWSAVAVGMPLLLAASGVLPPLTLRWLPAARTSVATTVMPVDTPAPVDAPAATTPHLSPTSAAPLGEWSWREAVVAIYALGALGMLARLTIGYMVLRRLVKMSRAVQLPDLYEALESPLIAVPMTAGWRDAKILLPVEWREWSDAKLNAALAHERTHIARGDWAVAMAAGLNRCVFWFHPLAWWVERRLSSLAEEACDDAALLETGSRESYALALLDMAAAVKSARGRMVREAMAMARASEVTSRVERVLDEDRQIPRAFSGRRRMALAACSLPLIYAAAVVQVGPAVAQQVPPPQRVVSIRVLEEHPLTQTPTSLSATMASAMELTPATAAALEQHLAVNPDDLRTRQQLVNYYFFNVMTAPRVNHVLWMIEHHAESPLLVSAAGMIGTRGPATDQASYQRADSAWRNQTAKHFNNAVVLGNAAAFHEQPGGDYYEAERLWTAAHVLEPGNSKWTQRLARLYTSAMLAGAQQTGRPLTELVNFAPHAKRALESSADAAILRAAALGLQGNVDLLLKLDRDSGGGAIVNGDSAAELSKFARDLQIRVQSLAPGASGDAHPSGNLAEVLKRESDRYLVTQASISTTQAVAHSEAISQDQVPQLLSSPPPVYPQIASTARISGTVTLAVTIGLDGRPTQIEIVSGHAMLQQAALAAVRHWLWEPYTRNGVPTSALFQVDVAFTPEMMLEFAAAIAISQDQVPQVVSSVPPIYPQIAKTARISDDVRVQVTIDRQGRPVELRAISGHAMLRHSAVTAVEQWVWTPYTQNGVPTTATFYVDVPFVLNQ